MSVRDKLARLIFTTDNRNARDPEAEWELAKVLDADGYTMTEYAYAIADGLLAAGVTIPAGEAPTVDLIGKVCTRSDLGGYA